MICEEKLVSYAEKWLHDIKELDGEISSALSMSLQRRLRWQINSQLEQELCDQIYWKFHRRIDEQEGIPRLV